MLEDKTPPIGREVGKGRSSVEEVPAALKNKALALHRTSVGLPKIFKTQSLANPSWTILLSLFIARSEALDARLPALSVANHLSQPVAETTIDGLAAAGLAVWLPDARGNARAAVQITETGMDHMRRFLETVSIAA